MKAHELYAAVDPAIVTQMLDWFRANDRNVYKSAVATLAGNRKLRPVFIEKKPLADQYTWLHKTLKLNACDTIGEHLLQSFLMAGQQSLLAMFCDGMGIPHDGKGSVVGDLPKKLDPSGLPAKSIPRWRRRATTATTTEFFPTRRRRRQVAARLVASLAVRVRRPRLGRRPVRAVRLVELSASTPADWGT